MKSSERTDPETLLARVREVGASELGALLEVYRQYLALLVRIQIGKKLRAKLDVEDVVQEAFLEAHRAFGRFRGATTGEFLAWLRQITAGVLANQVRHYYGTKRRDIRLERSLADSLDRSSAVLDGGLIAGDTSPSHHATRREMAVRLADALAGLPENYREVIILRQLEDLPFPEVARRMGRTVDSVKNLWVRALARLRRGLEDPHELNA
jgi:RNA polymerase sigma-70 factor (ECF subfamily)